MDSKEKFLDELLAAYKQSILTDSLEPLEKFNKDREQVENKFKEHSDKLSVLFNEERIDSKQYLDLAKSLVDTATSAYATGNLEEFKIFESKSQI